MEYKIQMQYIDNDGELMAVSYVYSKHAITNDVNNPTKFYGTLLSLHEKLTGTREVDSTVKTSLIVIDGKDELQVEFSLIDMPKYMKSFNPFAAMLTTINETLFEHKLKISYKKQ